MPGDVDVCLAAALQRGHGDAAGIRSNAVRDERVVWSDADCLGSMEYQVDLPCRDPNAHRGESSGIMESCGTS